MIRILNFFCIALMGLSILGLYHVSERARLANIELNSVNRQIADERAAISVLETEWEHVAGPGRVAELAAAKFGLDNTATAQLSSLELLPRRGDEAPLTPSPIRRASATEPASTPKLQQISVRDGTQ
ncbi:MAG TPA: hypothetical protein VG843_14300 [Rhizomicrobium sp.]|jgi:hypothetical protein|nr:hypothetical protein [Rhizomicrobium sp.]